MVNGPSVRLGKVELAVGHRLPEEELHAVIAGFLPMPRRDVTPSASAYQEALQTSPDELFGTWPVSESSIQGPRPWHLTEGSWLPET